VFDIGSAAFRSVLVIALVAEILVPSLPAAATESNQCVKPGGHAAIVKACGARWSATNIQAHVAAGQLGDDSAACLAQTAALLNAEAAQWSRSGSYVPYTGPQPCGHVPAVAAADDGLVATVCGDKVWTYGNAGNVSCTAEIAGFARGFALQQAAKSAAAAEADAKAVSDATTVVLESLTAATQSFSWNELVTDDGADIDTNGNSVPHTCVEYLSGRIKYNCFVTPWSVTASAATLTGCKLAIFQGGPQQGDDIDLERNPIPSDNTNPTVYDLVIVASPANAYDLRTYQDPTMLVRSRRASARSDPKTIVTVNDANVAQQAASALSTVITHCMASHN